MPKEFLVTEPYDITFHDYQELPLQPKEVRVKSILSGISHGTELNLFRGTTPMYEKEFDQELRLFLPRKGKNFYPLMLGYEMVGEVVEVGTSVSTLKPGDQVHGYLKHRETNVAQEENLIKLPPGCTVESALFLALGTVALIGIHDAKIKVGDEVAVFGLGVIGLLGVQLAKLNGAKIVYAVDPIKMRRDAAQAFGADVALDPMVCDAALEIKEHGRRKGVDVALECSGSYPSLAQAIRSVQKAGTLVTLGYYQGDSSQLDLGAEWHHNRLTMLGSMGVWNCPHRDAPLWDYLRVKLTILDLLTNKKLRTDGFITHEFPFQKIEEAYNLIETNPQETIKVVIRY